MIRYRELFVIAPQDAWSSGTSLSLAREPNASGGWSRRKESMVPSLFHRGIIRLCIISALSAGVLLTPALAFAAGLDGTVVDPNGLATPGATVLISDRSVIRATALTDDQGRFEITDLPAGRYEVRVALDGFGAAAVTVDLAADGVGSAGSRARSASGARRSSALTVNPKCALDHLDTYPIKSANEGCVFEECGSGAAGRGS